MDYLDPRKRLRHTITLYVGYVLIGIAIIIATIVLLYQAYGFGIDRKGTVIQNGLVFISSQPRPADIYINGKLEAAKTNTRLALPEASYNLALHRDGYQDWKRTIAIEGGKVFHYDYPFLVPKTITSTKLLSYDQAPTLITQSPDQRWLVVAQPAAPRTFDVFDLKTPVKTPVTITLPDSVLAAATTESWQLIEWADDNQHVLLQHVYDGKSEYVLVDRQTPAQSVNLTTTLAINPTRLNLIDRKYDRYYAYEASNQTLSRLSLKSVAPTPALSGVISYQSYGSDVLLYATKIGASAGKVRISLQTGGRIYTIRSVTADADYLLDITKYDNTFYAVIGASSESRVYIYRDPVAQIGSNVFQSPTPLQVLHVDKPTFVGFSSSAQYIVAENGSQFGVYDIENKHGYNYLSKQPLDSPQPHASWMDGNRLTYISNGKQVIFDYDYQNVRELGKALPASKPLFSPDYKYSYTVVSGSAGQTVISQTALLIPSEL
ncbi:MAG: PEGA domain-containing protein [Patescibacteria group bacterium]|nr:PEGA domain-containing protein [Patescibacteria group bacterium]